MASDLDAGPAPRSGQAAEAAFVCFDLETTGLISGVDRVVEIGAVAFDLNGVRGQFQCFVDPGVPIPEEARRVNHISDEMVRRSPPIEEALPRLLSFIANACPIAHNATFDVGFLCADIYRIRDRACLDATDCRIIDTRALAQKAFPGRRSYSLDSLVRDLGLGADGRPQPADRGSAHLGALPHGGSTEHPASQAHRALADSFRCRAVFLACVEKLSAHGPLSVDALVSMGGEPLSLRTYAPRRPRIAAELQSAMASGQTVEIHYTSDCGERTVRRIKPASFRVLGGSPAIVAFCFLRNADRTFLLDGITDIRELP